MKSTFLRAVSLILSALMLTAALASCGDAAAAPAVTEAAGTETAAEEVVTEVTRRQSALPEDLDFNGRTFRQTAFEWQGYKYYFFAEEQTGDIMNDAVYERKLNTEETLNVKLSYISAGTTAGDVAKVVKPTILAGDDAYDQVCFHCIDNIATFASSGYLYNLDTLPNIDITAEWWNQRQMDTLRLGRNTYYAINDFMLPCPYVVYYSKEMVENYGMDDPYQLVYDGKWVVDLFVKLCEDVTQDIDGDGKMAMETDQFGLTANEYSKYISFAYGSEQPLVQRGGDGRVELVCNTEKTVHLVELFAGISSKGCIFESSNEFGDQLTLDTGRLLFQLGTLSLAEEMREYDVELGFLPYPKYNEQQDDYASLDWGGLMGVPVTISDPECIGAVIEFLAWDSANNVIPTYYDTVLTGKLARGTDDEAMLDIIFDTICYDPGCNYFGFSEGFQDLFYVISNLAIKTKSADYASWYAKNETKAAGVLDKFYTALEETESN